MDEVLHEVSELEIAGTYNSNVLLDDIVRMSVKALGFAPNRNNFMFKRKPLEKLHQTKFGKVIPAFKSFESKQVNRNHKSVDNGARSNEPIGYVENAWLREDGIYLDLVLWKRAISDNELAQIRLDQTHVSMEVEYTEPKKENGVRTMSENSTISFVGIAVLFDGIQPGDQNSGIISVENALYRETSEEPILTKHNIGIEDESSSTSTPQGEQMENLTPEQFAELTAELAAAKEQKALLEAEKADLLAKQELAAVSQADLEGKLAERDAKLDELLAKESEYISLQTQVAAMRDTAFQDNLGKCFSMDTLSDEQKCFVRSLFSDCYGNADNAPFMAKAAMLVGICNAASDDVVTITKSSASTEDSTVAGGDLGTATSNEAAVVADGTVATVAETAVVENETVTAPIEAPSIAASQSNEAEFNYRHLRSR